MMLIVLAVTAVSTSDSLKADGGIQNHGMSKDDILRAVGNTNTRLYGSDDILKAASAKDFNENSAVLKNFLPTLDKYISSNYPKIEKNYNEARLISTVFLPLIKIVFDAREELNSIPAHPSSAQHEDSRFKPGAALVKKSQFKDEENKIKIDKVLTSLAQAEQTLDSNASNLSKISYSLEAMNPATPQQKDALFILKDVLIQYYITNIERAKKAVKLVKAKAEALKQAYAQ